MVDNNDTDGKIPNKFYNKCREEAGIVNFAAVERARRIRRIDRYEHIVKCYDGDMDSIARRQR